MRAAAQTGGGTTTFTIKDVTAASALNGSCYGSCLGAGNSPQYCEQFCSSGAGATSTSSGISGGVPDTSSGTPGTTITTQGGEVISTSNTGNAQDTISFWLDTILIAVILILMAFKIYGAM